MFTRVGAFLTTLVVMSLYVIFSAVCIWIGYWFSNVVYAAGLWPIGAIIRIGLFFGVLGLGLLVLLTPVMAIAAFVNPKSK